jgi:hypothetical protein
MVNVTEAVRKYLGFDYAYLTEAEGGNRCFCEFASLSGADWFVRASARLDEGRWILHVHFKKYELEYFTLLSKAEGKNLYKVVVSKVGDRCVQEIEFDEKIAYLEKNEAVWNKRRETRVVVGAEGFEKFGLNSLKQDVYIAGEKYPCVLNDVSPRGLRFTTYAHDYLTVGSSLKVGLLFVNPLVRTEVGGIIRSVVIKDVEGRKGGVAVVSLEVPEPGEVYERRVASHTEG